MKLEALFTRVAAFGVRRPRVVLTATALVVLVALGLAATRLELRTSNLDLVDPELPAVKRFLDFAAEFGTPNVLVVVFEGDDPAALAAAVDRVGPQLRSAPGVRSVIDRLPFEPEALEILGTDPYLRSRDGKMAFLFVQPDDPHSSAETIAPFVIGVRRALAATELEPLGVRAGLTGMPQYALDDRDVIQRDISMLSLVSLGLILALFVGAFGALRRPLLAAVALLAGVAASLGLIALYPGHLTLLSAFFGSILFGLGIDYGIHTIDRVEELVADELDETMAIPRALGSLADGLTTGALTTASALFALCFSGFKGFAELGIVAGMGILICLAATVVVLPALLVAWKPKPGHERRLDERRIGRVLAALQSRPLAWGLALAALASLLVGGPGFDTDYLDLQPKGSETVRLEREMVRRSNWSPEFAVFVAETREQVKELSWKLIDDPTVGAVRSIRDFELLPDLPGASPELAAAFRSSFISPRGRFAVYAYPIADVWKPEEQRRFVAAMQAIDPKVTGMPILGSFMVELSEHALDVATVLGSVLLLLWVWLDFRRPLPTLLAVLPTFLTAVALHALLRLLDIPWNPLSIMALPVVLGIAVDDGVHVVHRFLAERGDLVRTLAGTGRSVVMTSATTIAAFGTLGLTAHRGLASFALTLTLGVALALVLSVLVLPELLKIFAPVVSRSAPANGLATRDAYIAYTHRFFAKWLRFYDLFAGSIFWVYDAGARRAVDAPGRRVLDVCTGTGEIALRCARRGAKVTGIDVTPEMLAKARGKTLGLGIDLELMDARRLAFADQSFEVATISFALHDMPHRVAVEVLREVARVTREKIVIVDYAFPRARWLARVLVAMVNRVESAYFLRFSRGGVEELLAEAGLAIDRKRFLLPCFAVYEVPVAVKTAS